MPASRLATATLAGSLLLAGPVRAFAQASPDSATLAAAHQVLLATHSAENMLAAMDQALAAERQASPQVPAAFWPAFQARIHQDAPQLVDSIATLYARTFSKADLEALLAFYQSPLGQRYVAALPSITTESMAIGQRFGARVGAEVGASLVKH